MVHAEGLLSLETVQQHRCTMLDLFSEIDRLLRPEVQQSFVPVSCYRVLDIMHWSRFCNQSEVKNKGTYKGYDIKRTTKHRPLT